jgi:hypothetical protein
MYFVLRLREEVVKGIGKFFDVLVLGHAVTHVNV